MNRSEARCEAFKLIFQLEAHKDSFEEVISYFEESNPELKKTDKKQFNYIVKTAMGTFENINEIDNTIEQNLSEGWKVLRLSKPSLAILRLAVYEIMYSEDVPAHVAANEAVELAKVYDEDSAPSFVNGVLSGVIRGHLEK